LSVILEQGINGRGIGPEAVSQQAGSNPFLQAALASRDSAETRSIEALAMSENRLMNCMLIF
jgi:hypothetical protein